MNAAPRPVLPLRPAGPGPRGAPAPPQGPTPWHPRHLLRAPHRLAFVLAMQLLLGAALWWALLQLAVVLRVAAALNGAPPWPLTAAALLWAGVVGVWGLRLMGWYGRPRADGRPG